MTRNRTRVTSITEADASKFSRDEAEGATLWCENILGFHLLRQRKKCAWRYRYQNDAGELRTATVGKFPDALPEHAAAIALKWRQERADPLRDKQRDKLSRKQRAIDADARILSNYLAGGFQAYLDAFKPANAAALKSRFSGGNLSRFADLDMATITRAMINKWQADMVKKGLAHATIRRDFGDLRALLNRAAADEILQANPIAGHKLQPAPIGEQTLILEDPEKAKRRLLTPKEMRGILSGLDLFSEEIRSQRRNSRSHGKPGLPDLDAVEFPHWFIALCKLALATGWRPSDLYALQWREVDFRSSGKLVKFAEKGKVALRRGKEPTKLETPLSTDTKRMLKAWWQQQGRPDQGLVFPSPRTGAQLDAQAHKKPWCRVKRLGRLPPVLEFYSLRHHAISAMVAAGIPLMTVARLVGHKDPAMIAKHYAHLCPDSATAALDVVAATIRKAQKVAA